MFLNEAYNIINEFNLDPLKSKYTKAVSNIKPGTVQHSIGGALGGALVQNLRYENAKKKLIELRQNCNGDKKCIEIINNKIDDINNQIGGKMVKGALVGGVVAGGLNQALLNTIVSKVK